MGVGKLKAGEQPRLDARRGPPVPYLGRSFHSLAGFLDDNESNNSLLECSPPESYDEIMRQALYAAPEGSTPLYTPWTNRVLENEKNYQSCGARKYKPVHRKVRPVPSYMPDAKGQEFKPIPLPEILPLPLDPPSITNFKCTGRLTKDRLDKILSRIPEDFLKPREIDLLAHVLQTRQMALAFDDEERGTFSSKYFPDYEIPVIEHTPWIQPPIRIPKAIENEVRRLLIEQLKAGKFEHSTASYRSRIFAVEKKPATLGLRLVNDVQELNKVTVRDSALPPRPDDFAENAVGRVIYGLADLFAGYDGRRLALNSRPLTTFGSMIGPHRLTSLPQGFTNSMPEFQRCATHTIAEEIPKHSDCFVDDISMYGPFSRYNNMEVSPGIRRFVYEYATTVYRLFARFEAAGITASGKKLYIATPKLHVVGSVVSAEGWHLAQGLVSKIEKWPTPTSVSEVRAFLGTAGVGRKWIRNFSIIALPLTRLTRISVVVFIFEDEEVQAFVALKLAITRAPVLIKIDYELAKLIRPLPRDSDEGLVIVAIDSCKLGSGWVLYQQRDGLIKPAIYGSCTFNETESRYSQPKAELYGVFRAVKNLRHRIWGLHFRVDVDAKFLIEMMATPDLPNAPMNRWIAFLNLFDFYLNYVPAEKHKVPDGLSRRPRAEDDSDEEDVDEVLDKFVGCAVLYNRAVNGRILNATIHAGTLLMAFRRLPITPYATFNTSSECSDITWPTVSDAVSISIMPETNTTEGIQPDDANSLLALSMLRFVDHHSFYLGKEFELRKLEKREVLTYQLGDELVDLEVSLYARAYAGNPPSVLSISVANQTNPAYLGYLQMPDHRLLYSDVENKPPTCAVHAFRVMEDDNPGFWDDLKHYLKTMELPKRVRRSKDAIRKFIRRSKRFVLHDDRLWLTGKGKPPRLVVIDKIRRRDLISEAHNDTGHRGRDTTYRLLTDRFYWPNMYDEIAYFVKSCNACQLRSRHKPRVPFAPTWNSAILRRFDLDTVHMEDGFGGKHFLLQAIEPSINWPEARAATKNDSATWAKFIYEDIISRFGCIPVFVVDNGSEFKGITEILFKQYGITVIFTTTYHPEGNAINERSHQTLVNSIRKSCGKDSNKWPLMVHACLLSMRCTATRVTGYTPYYLLYGRHPFLAFDIADRTWDFLDWHQVKTTEELIALRAQQLVKREKDLVIALEQQKESRKKAVDDFNKKYEKYMVTNDFDIGTWVLVHETWLDGQKGNKGALRWSGPYVVHEKFNNKTYRLREIDGTVRRETIDKHRLKIFYYRPDHQTIKTVSSNQYNVAAATETASPEARSMFNALFGNDFLGTHYPQSLVIGKVLKTLNPTLSQSCQFTTAGRWNSRPPTFIDIMERDAFLATTGTTLDNGRIKVKKIKQTNFDDLQRWTPDYLPWY